MDLLPFIQRLDNDTSLDFEDTMAVIEANYNYSPTRFANGDLLNEAGTNEGSCKIFAFARMNSLNEEQTLNCFGRFYRQDVLQNPEGSDHGNIRNFMVHGWSGVSFDSAPLQPKKV